MNRSGGGWYVGPVSNIDSLENALEGVLLAMIGETLDDGNDVNGIRVVDKSTSRKGCAYRMELWLKSNEVRDTIKIRLKKALGVDCSSSKIHWKSHSPTGY